MRLEDIGFYTLCDDRAKNVSVGSPLWRCELILTERCNFKCPYCRTLRPDCQGDVPLDRAKEIVTLWAEHGLRNIRFSGGEPAVYKGLVDLISHTRDRGIGRIAVSTNGSAPLSYYERLIAAGVNDFSISLDACCSSDGDRMAGGVAGAWERVTANIRDLSKLTYVTVGIVLTEETLHTARDVVVFAHDLGVRDIRVIPSAQFAQGLEKLDLPQTVLDAHPILRYRLANMLHGKPIRGLGPTDSQRCHLVLDDMAVAGDQHFPCIIYLREGGSPIGKVGPGMREERKAWSESHNCLSDPICANNCLDVCVDYNNRVTLYKERGK